MRSSGLIIQKFKIMTKLNKEIELEASTEPAISYSTCYKQDLFGVDEKIIYKSAPLPFQGQKRAYIRKFNNALKKFPSNSTYVDLFGGSGLLSHNIKMTHPDSVVIYNDFDNFSERLQNIDKTNKLLSKIRDVIPKTVKHKERLCGETKSKIIDIIKNEIGYIDIITLSKSLFFGGTYASSLSEIYNYKTFYNSISKKEYASNGYLKDVIVVRDCYKNIFNEYKTKDNVIFILDPPYMSTNVSSYNSVFHWKITEYLNIIKTLQGLNKFIYFTSERSGLIDIFEFMEKHYKVENPFSNAVVEKIKTSAINSVYEDIMIYKYR